MENQRIFRMSQQDYLLDWLLGLRVNFQGRFLDCALHNGIERGISHRNTGRQSDLRGKDHEYIWDMLDLK